MQATISGHNIAATAALIYISRDVEGNQTGGTLQFTSSAYVGGLAPNNALPNSFLGLGSSDIPEDLQTRLVSVLTELYLLGVNLRQVGADGYTEPKPVTE